MGDPRPENSGNEVTMLNGGREMSICARGLGPYFPTSFHGWRTNWALTSAEGLFRKRDI